MLFTFSQVDMRADSCFINSSDLGRQHSLPPAIGHILLISPEYYIYIVEEKVPVTIGMRVHNIFDV